MMVAMADAVVRDGASEDVREWTEKVYNAIRGVAGDLPTCLAAEASVRATAIILLVCAQDGKGTKALDKGAGMFRAFAKTIELVGERVQ